MENADRLEALLQATKGASLEEERALLNQVRGALAAVYNHPKADLAEDERTRLKTSLDGAIQLTAQRLGAIPEQIRRENRALRAVEARLRQSEAPKDQKRKRGAPIRNKDRNDWIVKQRREGATLQAILAALLTECEKKQSWDPVSSVQAIHTICIKSESNLAIAAIHAKSNFKSNP
jgi:hypothetical protein